MPLTPVNELGPTGGILKPSSSDSGLDDGTRTLEDSRTFSELDNLLETDERFTYVQNEANKLGKWSLRFGDPHLEDDFVAHYKADAPERIRKALWAFFAIHMLLLCEDFLAWSTWATGPWTTLYIIVGIRLVIIRELILILLQCVRRWALLIATQDHILEAVFALSATDLRRLRFDRMDIVFGHGYPCDARTWVAKLGLLEMCVFPALYVIHLPLCPLQVSY